MKEKTFDKPVWHEIALEVLEEACRECDCWEFGNKSIMEYLRDQGIITTYGSAQTMAWKHGYKCPKLSRGGWHGNQYKDVNGKRRALHRSEG